VPNTQTHINLRLSNECIMFRLVNAAHLLRSV
jgi:hypothetical protein